MTRRLPPRPARREADSQALDVVLAEYELVRELRTAHSGNASTQVGQLFVAGSVAVAAIAAVASLGGQMTALRFVAIGGIGATMLVLGLLVFRRFVVLSARRYEYDVMLNALRTFMVDQLPAVRPYLLLPDLRESAERTAPSNGVARLITAFNSALIGVGAAAASWVAWQNVLLATALALPLAVTSVVLHLMHELGTVNRSRRHMSKVLKLRGWNIEP